MPEIAFTNALKRFFPTLMRKKVMAATVKEAIDGLEIDYPGLKQYLLTEHGSLRHHVNIFIGDELIQDRETLSDALKDSDEIYVMQALSGG